MVSFLRLPVHTKLMVWCDVKYSDIGGDGQDGIEPISHIATLKMLMDVNVLQELTTGFSYVCQLHSSNEPCSVIWN